MFDWAVNIGLVELCEMQSPNAESLTQLCHTRGIWGHIACLQQICEGHCSDVQTWSDDDETHPIDREFMNSSLLLATI